MQFTRRSVLGSAVAGASLALAGTRLAGATTENPMEGTPEIAADPNATPVGGSLTVYSGRNEGLVGPLLESIESALGIDIEVRYAGTSELAATLLEEGDASPADVFFSQDAGALGALAKAGLLAELPEETLAKVDSRFQSFDGHWIGVSGRARVLAYNSDTTDPATLPASVKDLTAPEWAGKVGWAPTNASFQTFVTAFRLIEGEDAAREWLQAMIDNGTVAFEGNADIVRAVASEEIGVGLVNHYYKYEISAEEGEDIPVGNHFFAAGDVGSLINVAGVGILASAKNTVQAAAFVDYLLGETAQTYFAEQTFEYPLSAGVEPAVELVPLDELEAPEIDLNDLDDLEGTLELLAEVSLI
jgi:iron(III) transport system substrate-binding protein